VAHRQMPQYELTTRMRWDPARSRRMNDLLQGVQTMTTDSGRQHPGRYGAPLYLVTKSMATRFTIAATGEGFGDQKGNCAARNSATRYRAGRVGRDFFSAA